MTTTVTADGVSPARRRFSILSTPAAIADPYPVYAQLRARTGPFWDESSHEWMVSRYEDVREVLQRSDLFSSARRVDNIVGGLPPAVRAEVGELENTLRNWLLFMDDPQHSRLRLIVHGVLNGRRLLDEAIGHAAAIADELLTRFPASCGEPVDFMSAFAHPFPLRVISALLGVPDEDFPVIERWSDAIARFLVILPRPTDTADRAAEGFSAVSAYLCDLLRQRRAQPRADVLSALSTVRTAAGGLSDQEIVHTAAMLLFQGHETTKNLLGNGLLALLRHPDTLAAVRADPSLLGATVGELARFDNPIQFVTRVARQDTTLGGARIRAGQLVLAIVASANRDPAVFTEPDALRLDRRQPRLTGDERGGGPRKQALSFGVAHHLCVGQQLARSEVEVALGALVQRWDAIELADGPLEHRHILSIRSLCRLPIQVAPAVGGRG